MDHRCKIGIFMGKTAPDSEDVHHQQSMILVPLDTPGVKILRALTVFGYDDAPHGHGEVDFVNVKVHKSNMLLGEGRGFEIAQGRLGPGKLGKYLPFGLFKKVLSFFKDASTTACDRSASLSARSRQ